MIVQASFNFVIVITLIVSSFFIGRINNLTLIYTSSIAIVLTTALLPVVPNENLKIAVLFGTGIFIGLGLLGFLTYFWKTTIPEERGRVSGLIGFVALPINFFVAYIVAPGLGFLGTISLNIIVNLAIVVIVLLNPKKTMPTTKLIEEGGYFEKRTVLLYTIPWVLFSLVNVTLAKNASAIISQEASSTSYLVLLGLQFIGVVFGCIAGGTIADFFGRRLSLAFSLTAYGTSAALLGIFTSNEVLSFVYILNGLSWGILFTIYIFVVWGDLSNKDNCAKMYSVGLATYYLTIGIGLLTQISIPVVISSLATCVLVFLSNIPIALAPEISSSHFRERMRMRRYVKAIKKIGEEARNQG
jgi:MFS family permease